MLERSEFRKLAGLRANVAKELCEEKVDLSTQDIFRYLERALFGEYGYGGGGCNMPLAQSPSPRGGEKDEPTVYDVAGSCLDALEKKGYPKDKLAALRSYFQKMEAAEAARRDAEKAMSALYSERWDKMDNG